MPRKRKATPEGVVQLPAESDILKFIEEQPGKVGKREIARAFGLHGAGLRSELRDMLKRLERDGRIDRRARSVTKSGTIPPVAVLQVIGQDHDGELIAEPVEWDEKAGRRPKVVLEIRKAQGRQETLQPPAKGDRILAKVTRQRDPQYPYSASIVRRLSTRENRVIGIFRQVRGEGFRIIPAERKQRNELIVLPDDANGAQPGELVEAEIVRDRGRGLLHARVRQRLGDAGDQRNVSLIAIHQHGIPDRFPDRVLAEAAKLPPATMAGRRDLRDVPLVTIDPPDARDHDDAVFAEPDDDPKNAGGFRVIVAIADVAAYVKPGSSLDREARLRGNSVYFPDRVVPMLPERISNDLCSLREGEDRPAIACFLRFDKSGTKIDHRFDRVMMRSAAKLSYEQAQAAIDGNPRGRAEVVLEPVLKPLWAAYHAMKKARDARAPLELDVPERKLVLDAHGLIERVVTPLRLDAHKLIEEMMIQANVAAAETLEKMRTPLIYRVHDAPSREKIAALAEFLQTVGQSLPKGQVMTPRHFNQVLKNAEGSENQHIVNEVVLRTQAQAVYSPENLGHFGLHLTRYAHFTSPIRRYADLIVHRALITALGFGSDGLSPEDVGRLDETAEMISGAERRAMAAERETVDRLVALHLKDRVGSVFNAKISGVTGAGLFVKLDDMGADGFVPAMTLAGDRFFHDEAQHALIGIRTGEAYRLGDHVEVRLLEVTPISGGLRFEMVSDGRKGARPTRLSRRPGRPNRSPRPPRRGRR
ncbi:MAG: ribonuclease R [Hyphomicrobiales bacterium]